MRLPPPASCVRSRSSRRAGSIVDARPPAPVAGGNVETSQRIVDTLMRALAQAVPDRVPAASAGTMSNLTIGGIDPRTGEPFTYYETTAGGMGARPTLDGISGVHTHMTNSLNTPIEALEYAYPFRVRRYGYRTGSGGRGRFRGGDGLVREIELLAPAQVTLLADRRRLRPWGLAGGGEGAPGRAVVTDAATGYASELPGKCSRYLAGWGYPSYRNAGRRRMGSVRKELPATKPISRRCNFALDSALRTTFPEETPIPTVGLKFRVGVSGCVLRSLSVLQD